MSMVAALPWSPVVPALISDSKDSLHSTSDFSEMPNEVALPCLSWKV